MVKEKKRIQVASPGAEPNEALATPEDVSRMSFSDNYAAALAAAIEARNMFQIMTKTGSMIENLTPPLMEDNSLSEKLFGLNQKIRKHDIFLQAPTVPQTSSQKMGITTKTSMDDITANVATTQTGDIIDDLGGIEDKTETTEQEPIRTLPFIKIVLRKTKEILLFEQRSTTVLRGTDEAQQVEDDNKYYDYITEGKGRVRRTESSEAQTTDVLYKSRDANTESIYTATVVSYVSNFEMFDTYRNLETTTTSVAVGDAQRISVTTYKVGGVDQFLEISQSRSFKFALMVTLRILAGNIFEQEQRRFRNMIMPDPMSRDVQFTYSLNHLFTFNPLSDSPQQRRAVVDIAFCPGNGDIIAVAYGIFTYLTTNVPEEGYCCIWNIKNPINPERVFHYDKLVVSVQFSPFIPQLLAIGLYDGRIEVRDITNFNDPPIAVSQRTDTSTCDPIIEIEWLPQMSTTEVAEIEPLLTLSQNTSVTKYRIINSPYLLGYHQIQLDRVEGSPEGLLISRITNQAQSNRHPQGKNMILHPKQHDVYFILTDEGCIHKCSTNHPHQHLELLQVHDGAVNVMDFSPWSPKLFLTAGNDWSIRIWIEGILEPLITLKNEIGPIHCAGWSKTHSTVIVSITRKVISIWDIRRSILIPVSTTVIERSYYTLFRFSRCGRSIAVGNERGELMILSFENMPFPPHFQYNELELAIYRAIEIYPVLTAELKSIGFFGYPEHRRSRRHCS